MDAPDTPAPPDPAKTAEAQGAINRETAYTNWAMSRVNQESPWGKQTWVRNLDTPGGRAWAAYEGSFDPGKPVSPPSSSIPTAAPAPTGTAGAPGGGYWTPTGGDGGGMAWVSDGTHTVGDALSAGSLSSSATGGSRASMPPPGIEDSWTLKTELSPEQQRMLSSQQRIGQNALDIGEEQLGRVSSALASPLSAEGLPSRIMSLGPAPTLTTTIADAGAITRGMPGGGPGIKTDVARTTYGMTDTVDPTTGAIKYDPGYSGVADLASKAGSITRSAGYDGKASLMGDAGSIQAALNLSGLSSLPGINDFGTERQRVEDALYGRNTSRLDPQWQQAETALRTRLANQGITVGSAAWDSEWSNFNRAKNDAYSTARQDAISSGGTEQSRLFADALSGRKQGYTETLGAGEFANAAQGQKYAQLATDRNRYTSELDRLMKSGNDAQAQSFAQLSADRSRYTGELDKLLQANNTAQQQNFAQNLGRAQFRNDAQQQQHQQNLSDMMAHNAAQKQYFENNLAANKFANDAQAQAFTQNAARAAFGNSAAAQRYNMDLLGANFANTNRDAALSERSTLRMTPLNELRGLMGMGAITAPTFGTPQVPQMASPDLMGATYQSYNAQANAANAAANNQMGLFNGLMGLAGSGMTAFAMSDRRVKKDVSRIGTAENGIPLYTFRYVFDHDEAPLRVGVMAQDVETVKPEAVAEFGGVKMVDYGRVFEEPRA